MKKKMGFTLVELLAVIVILAVILVIAVPRITEVIENSRKATFESSAKTIAASAEKRKMENDILENTDTISCSDVVNINETDYLSCSITFDEDTAKVSMIGDGKFSKLLINEGTKDNAVAESRLIANYVRILYSDTNTRKKNNLKIDNTIDKNIRYYGGNPNNYVKFKDSDDVWRIIGIFDGYVKIIRDRFITTRQWSVNVNGLNNGQGINQWGKSIDTSNNSEYAGADLQVYLNGDYYNSLSDITKSAIDYHKWNTAGVEWSKMKDTAKFYEAERGTKTSKECTSSDWCNDTIIRTSKWEGYIALPYATDWGYASSVEGCETYMQQQENEVYICKNDNWMHNTKFSNWYESVTWFLSPLNDNASAVYEVWDNGRIHAYEATRGFAIYPSVYLKSNVVIIDGKGSSESPYILDIEE